MKRQRITAKYIDTLPEGPEMDRLVARAIDRPIYPYSYQYVYAWGALESFAGNRHLHACVRTPFDKRRRDPRMDDDEDHSHPSWPLYWAGLTPMGTTGWNGRDDWRASGETMPLAVCRAILRAAHCKPQL